jgi:hypothetical protein
MLPVRVHPAAVLVRLVRRDGSGRRFGFRARDSAVMLGRVRVLD